LIGGGKKKKKSKARICLLRRKKKGEERQQNLPFLEREKKKDAGQRDLVMEVRGKGRREDATVSLYRDAGGGKEKKKNRFIFSG